MKLSKDIYQQFRQKIFGVVDPEVMGSLSDEELQRQISQAVDVLALDYERQIPALLKSNIVKALLNELIGLGPLQPLMEDPLITDIMVNGPDCVYIEKNGRLSRSDVTFINEQQVVDIGRRIATMVGRRVDESSPMVDARLKDGSRVNVIIPPLAIDGTTISIRKFRQNQMDLDTLVGYGSLSEEMARVLMIAARCRLNILISGGTGSGKTTLLNALSNYIDEDERIITIEDAAELRLQQPHVVRLETRAVSTENSAAITQRELLINSLRMRPDRIILGECRGSETFEMLQAMNTGHDGSMSTLHANTPRDAISRVESMVMMANLNQPLDAIRRAIVSAVDLVVQVNRLQDGSRKVVSVSEIVGLEGDNVVIEELFHFQTTSVRDGAVDGHYVSRGLMQRSVLVKRAEFFGLREELMSTVRSVA